MKGHWIKVFVPHKMRSKINSPNHHSTVKNKWKNIIHYHYRNKKPEIANVVHELGRCDTFKEGTFYKISSLSSRDNIWDFYRCLKATPHKNIGIEYQNSKAKEHKSDCKDDYRKSYNPVNGKYIVHWD